MSELVSKSSFLVLRNLPHLLLIQQVKGLYVIWSQGKLYLLMMLKQI